MNSHSESVALHSVHKENIFLKKAFWVRVLANMTKDIDTADAFKSAYIAINVLLAALLGIALFLLEFPLVKQFVLFIIVIPLSLFLAVKYLTLLPIVFFFLFLFIKLEYAIIALSIIAPLSFIWVLLV